MIDAALVMERIRAEFRKRRGQTPETERTAADRAYDTVHLKQLQHLGRLTEIAIPVSHRKRVGKAVMALRRILWKLLTPIVKQQSDANAATVALLAGLVADREAAFAEIRRLDERVAALEARLVASQETSTSR
jgi:hypothetical protein